MTAANMLRRIDSARSQVSHGVNEVSKVSGGETQSWWVDVKASATKFPKSMSEDLFLDLLRSMVRLWMVRLWIRVIRRKYSILVVLVSSLCSRSVVCRM